MTRTNNNIQSFERIDERDLHAYVDGLLDDHCAAKVESYLKRHPEKAAEAQDFIEYNKLLRKAYEHEADGDVPQRLLSVLNRPVTNMWPALGKVAAIIVLCALSAGAGWMGAYSGGGVISEEDGMVHNFLHQIAMNNESPFEAIPVQKLGINKGKQTDPLNWLTQKVALEMQAPDLTQAGYTLKRRRLVKRGSQEFVELKYTNSSRDAINIYVKARWETEAPTIEFAKKDNQSIAYWKEGPLIYALSGKLERNRAEKIAKLVRGSMTEISNPFPHIQDVQIIAPQSTQPVQPARGNFGNQPIVPITPLTAQKMKAVDG